MSSDLDALIATVCADSKYRYLQRDIVRSIGLIELGKRRNLREAIKATKTRLHQITGSYQVQRPKYAEWFTLLKEASAEPQALRHACQVVMAAHVSTRERLGILDEFYTTIFADLRPVNRVIDLACGHNPLALPWMKLSSSPSYYACDLQEDLMSFLNELWPLFDVAGQAISCDLLQAVPNFAADVAFVFKLLPCLQLLDATAALRLLLEINAPTLLISFPIQTIGGQNKGMASFYQQSFQTMIAKQCWQIQQYHFATELVFKVTR